MNLGLIIEPHPDDASALVSRGAVTTYGELRRQVAELRGGLTRVGVAPGDRVAVALPNTRFSVVSYLATLGVGAVAVPISPSSPSAEMSAELASVRPSVLIAGAAAAAGVGGLDRAALGIEHFLAPEGSDIAGATPF